MAVQGTVVTLTSSSGVLIAGSVAAGGPFHGVIRVTVRPSAAGTVFLGDATVTTAGFPLSSGDAPVTLTLNPGESLWGTSTGTTVAVLRVGETT